MALTMTAISLLARSHARQPFAGPILTLGRQGVYATVDQCRAAIASQGASPHPLPPSIDQGPNIPAFRSGPTTRFTNDVALFHLLCGRSAETLDVSDYEEADYIQDLNQPIAENLKGRFGVVIDGGTLEHVFDVAQTLRNIKEMLRPGGRIIHLTPMGNWPEHGYYQISPTLYHDFYVTNGFQFNECLIIEARVSDTESLYARPCRAWNWSPVRPSAPITSPHLLSVAFEATKIADVATHVPEQGEASRSSSSRLGGHGERVPGKLNRLKERLIGISPAFGTAVLAGKRLLGKDLTTRPWGLEYAGRI